MKIETSTALLLILLAAVFGSAQSSAPVQLSLSALRADGAFGFPQKDAQVLYDNENLRFSVTNNSDYVYAQAILWNDGDSSNGKMDGGKVVGDHSFVMLQLGTGKRWTPDVDRFYSLNPWPHMPGLHYQIAVDPVIVGLGADKFVSTGLNKDSKGKGHIRYVPTVEGKMVRIDTYLIPLKEVSKRKGDKMKICYFGYSPKPTLTVNSVGFEKRERYRCYQIPISTWEEIILDMNANIDVSN